MNLPPVLIYPPLEAYDTPDGWPRAGFGKPFCRATVALNELPRSGGTFSALYLHPDQTGTLLGDMLAGSLPLTPKEST